MRLLVDTHVWLWMQADPDRLGEAARSIVENVDNPLYFSSASSWEIAIKYGLGRLPLPAPPELYVPDRIVTSGVIPLQVEHGHALRVAALPNHHRDPFDRLLIAQAQMEGLIVLTADPIFQTYPVEMMMAG
jgi:PIN domain nuclease of toxin-antitoxin system